MAKQQKTKHKRLSLFTKYYIVVAAAAIASLLALGIIFFVFLYIVYIFHYLSIQFSSLLPYQMDSQDRKK